MITLTARDVRYYSSYDEDAFFEWLKKMRCVKRYWGEGVDLYIEVLMSKVNDVAVLEFIGLFKRYNVDMHQLAALEKPQFSSWFRDPKMHWHDAIFGSIRKNSS